MAELLQHCIDACRECGDVCQRTFYNHCLAEGGAHVERDHLLLMTDCISICAIAADFMIRRSRHHLETCRVCADICEACADSCSAIDTEEMQDCARICHLCAHHCRQMSSNEHLAA